MGTVMLSAFGILRCSLSLVGLITYSYLRLETYKYRQMIIIIITQTSDNQISFQMSNYVEYCLFFLSHFCLFMRSARGKNERENKHRRFGSVHCSHILWKFYHLLANQIHKQISFNLKCMLCRFWSIHYSKMKFRYTHSSIQSALSIFCLLWDFRPSVYRFFTDKFIWLGFVRYKCTNRYGYDSKCFQFCFTKFEIVHVGHYLCYSKPNLKQ